MTVRSLRRIALTLACLPLAPALAHSQSQEDIATQRCDSVIGAARVDSVFSGMFIEVRRIEGPYVAPATLSRMALQIGAMFTLPKPLRLSVFGGPARTHLLRPIGGDTLPDLRSPTVTGIYSVLMVPHDAAARVATARSTLMIGFDSAVKTAIWEAAGGEAGSLFHPPDDSLELVVRFTTDSTPGAVRIMSAYFPRMPIVDAVALPGNPTPQFPDSADAAGVDRGEVVLRFVVTRGGEPALNTVEILRATSGAFLRSAYNALGRQHFRPATIHGCAISESIEYPFIFVRPGEPPNSRH